MYTPGTPVSGAGGWVVGQERPVARATGPTYLYYDGFPSPSPVRVECVVEVSHHNDEDARVTWTELSEFNRQLCSQSASTFGKTDTNRQNQTKTDKNT